MHLGLIGGIGPAATEYYYRGLIASHKAAGRPLDLTIVNEESSVLVANFLRKDSAAQVTRYVRLLKRLSAAGAETAAITSLGGHFCYRELMPQSPLPIISAMEILNRHFIQNGIRRVGLIGTNTVMESGLYGDAPSVECVCPKGEDFHNTHEEYVDVATSGKCSDAQRAFFFEIGVALIRDQNAEVVLLAGTDLCLAFDGHDPGYPVVDAASVHVDALTQMSFGEWVN